MKDINHDLIHQLSEDLDSLWRYDRYLKSASECDHCSSLWGRLRKLDEEKVKLLQDEIRRHVMSKAFD